MSINTATIPISFDPAVKMTREQLFSFRPFAAWLDTLSHSLSQQRKNSSHPFHEHPYELHSVTVQAVDFFGGQRIGFVKLSVKVQNDEGATLPGSIFLRGGSVAMLVILEEEGAGEEWVLLTVQPRIPVGSLGFVELPAGMIDDDTFSGAAAKEIKEECGIEIKADGLIDMTELALEPLVAGGSEALKAAVYPSPGGCDEFMKIFAYRHKIDKGTLGEWKGRLTGLRDHGEKITLKVVRLTDLWKETLDSKTLSAVALWEGLKRAGKV